MKAKPIILIIGFFAAVAYVMWPILNRTMAPSNFDERKEVTVLFAQGLGIVALLITLVFTYRRLQVAEDTIRVSQEGQITERFTRAIQQLGDSKMEVRLGGIYALERIARDSPCDHWTVVEVLTAYVRENAPWRSAASSQAEPSSEGPPLARVKPRTDIQAILTVIGRRAEKNRKNEIRPVDLHNTDLRGAVLEDSHFACANFSGAHLEEVDFSRAHLEKARLEGATLKRASLANARLDMAILRNSHLEGAILSWASLTEAQLFGAHLEDCILWHADLQAANLAVGRLDRADLRSANLREAILLGTHLERANLNLAFLDGATFGYAGIRGLVQKYDSGLITSEELDESIREDVRPLLGRGPLGGINETFLADTPFNIKEVLKAHIEGADLYLAEGVTDEQLAVASTDNDTVLPEGVMRPSAAS